MDFLLFFLADFTQKKRDKMKCDKNIFIIELYMVSLLNINMIHIMYSHDICNIKEKQH